MLEVPIRKDHKVIKKSRWETEQFKLIAMPLKFSWDTTFFRIPLRTSATKRKSKGESGHPYLKPLSTLENGEVDPLISMEKEVELM
jgi:hypothetical protein